MNYKIYYRIGMSADGTDFFAQEFLFQEKKFVQKQIDAGNYFETKEDCLKMIEKLKNTLKN